MKTKNLAVVNFVYFLANFPMQFNDIIRAVWADDKLLADHLILKIDGIIAKECPNKGCLPPAAIVSFFFELSRGDQYKFAEWIERNYHVSEEHKNQPWSISVDVPIETVKDLFIAALEGGSNYWYYLPELEMVRKPEYKGLSLAEKICRAVIEQGEVVPVHDIEDDTDKLGEISRENIERGLRLFIQNNSWPDSDMDAGQADTFFQLVVMGEEVYG